MRKTQPTTKRAKFLRQPMSNCYNSYMVNNNNMKLTLRSTFFGKWCPIKHINDKIIPGGSVEPPRPALRRTTLWSWKFICSCLLYTPVIWIRIHFGSFCSTYKRCYALNLMMPLTWIRTGSTSLVYSSDLILVWALKRPDKFQLLAEQWTSFLVKNSVFKGFWSLKCNNHQLYHS